MGAQSHFYNGHKGLNKGRAQLNPRIDHPDYHCGRVREFGTVVQFWNCLRVSLTLLYMTVPNLAKNDDLDAKNYQVRIQTTTP